jgi:hypothetical protein
VNQVVNQVGDQVKNRVLNQVGDQVRDRVVNRALNQVGDQVWNQVGNQVVKVGDQVMDQVEFSWYGNYSDYGWISFYDFFEKIGIVENENFNKFREILKCNVYDMIQLEGLCVVCGLPKNIKRNDNNNLHSLEGPAIEWKDGYCQYWIDDVYFDKELFDKITKKEISAQEVVRLENIEQRYIALKTIGAEKILKELDAELIHKTDRNELYGLDGIIKDKTIKMLKYKCPSTGREYVKFVPYEMKNADEAQGWSFRLEFKEYQKLNIES